MHKTINLLLIVLIMQFACGCMGLSRNVINHHGVINSTVEFQPPGYFDGEMLYFCGTRNDSESDGVRNYKQTDATIGYHVVACEQSLKPVLIQKAIKDIPNLSIVDTIKNQYDNTKNKLLLESKNGSLAICYLNNNPDCPIQIMFSNGGVIYCLYLDKHLREWRPWYRYPDTGLVLILAIPIDIFTAPFQMAMESAWDWK